MMGGIAGLLIIVLGLYLLYDVVAGHASSIVGAINSTIDVSATPWLPKTSPPPQGLPKQPGPPIPTASPPAPFRIIGL